MINFILVWMSLVILGAVAGDKGSVIGNIYDYFFPGFIVAIIFAVLREGYNFMSMLIK